MWHDVSFLTLFLLGFFGGTHCVGMCGGLSSAFSLQLPAHVSRFSLILLLNLGRISSYVLMGGVMGGLAQWGLGWDETRGAQTMLFLLANVLLLLMGLHLAGVWSVAAQIERLGVPIWRKINPLLSRFLPIQSRSGCLLVGVLWGWLPCGLVYNASLYALGSGSAWQGAGLLLAFGLGTLPNLLAMGVFAAQLRGVLQRLWVRRVAGAAVSLWAMKVLWETARLVWA